MSGPFDISDVARELARRLRAGQLDVATVEAAAFALESMATVYERSRGVLAKALDADGRLPERCRNRGLR